MVQPSLATLMSEDVRDLLARAAAALPTQPAAAARLAEAALEASPDEPQAVFLLGAARRAAGDFIGALALLERLVQLWPAFAAGHFELAMARIGLGQSRPAIAALSATVRLDPDLGSAWRLLGDHFTLGGDRARARDAYLRQFRISLAEPDLRQAVDNLIEGRIDAAHAALDQVLQRAPGHPRGQYLRAEALIRQDRYPEATAILRTCVGRASDFDLARHTLAAALLRQGFYAEALACAATLVERDPGCVAYKVLRAAILDQAGGEAEAAAVFSALLEAFPDQPRAWIGQGHRLRALGRQADAVDAYRRALALQPGLGEAYWSLANLKTWHFTPQDRDAMRRQSRLAGLRPEDASQLRFALGKACEDAGAFDEAFDHYLEGNAIKRRALAYDGAAERAMTQRSRDLFTPAFFAERAGMGCPAPDPIFIVGLPRSGSTLLEQILASHSAVEGTRELPHIPLIVQALEAAGARQGDPAAYPDSIARLDGKALKALGETYLERARPSRGLGTPLFIDKTPQNFIHAGLIHLILPNATIIDARRHPLACCWSNFKQHFANGFAFAYDLADLGRYYRDYVTLMAHLDAVLPGRIHRVAYEDMVTDTEAQTRALLAACGLEFEAQCLRFFETGRPVRTPSSEQVRSPIFTDGLEPWRPFEAWLGPLKAALEG